MKKVIKYTVFILMIIIFCITLTLSSIIPKRYIEGNVKESALILNRETNRLMIPIYSKDLYMKFDNFTDSLMINTVYSINTKTPFYSSVVARKNYIDGTTETIYPDTTGELKSSSKYNELNQVGDLMDTVNNDTTESFEYARYWHGYLIFLRPLLTIMNVTQIRILLVIIFAILAIVLLNMIYKKINLTTMIIFLMGMMISDYFYIGISLQGAPVFLICIISSIIVMSEKWKDKNLLFLIIGGLTSFFVFFTVPIITLGIPLLLYVLLEQKNKNIRYKELYLNMIKLIIFWGIGYLGIWLSKWILADIIYHKGIINLAVSQLKYRAVVKDGNIFDIYTRMFLVIGKPLGISFIITISMLIYKIIRYKTLALKFNIKAILPYIFIALIGIIWYVILSEHSLQHYFFTYRNFFFILICILLMTCNILREDKKEN